MTFYESPYPSAAAAYRPAPPYPASDPYHAELARACAKGLGLLGPQAASQGVLAWRARVGPQGPRSQGSCPQAGRP